MNSIDEVKDRVTHFAVDAQKVCCCSCSIDVQLAARDFGADLTKEVEAFLATAKLNHDEAAANTAYVYLRVTIAYIQGLQMWLFLKDRQEAEAWIQLVDAQNSICFVKRFLSNPLFDEMQNHLRRAETILFPPQTFVSSSFTYAAAECSICKQKYGDCLHVAAKLYGGEMCTATFSGIESVNHVAIVEDPADKACRVTERRFDGYWHCTLTGKRIRPEAGENTNMVALLMRPD